jgi:hypothetical protein
MCALVQEPRGSGQADTGCAAGDDGGLAIEESHMCFLPGAVGSLLGAMSQTEQGLALAAAALRVPYLADQSGAFTTRNVHAN